jgi:hypothetical protein
MLRWAAGVLQYAALPVSSPKRQACAGPPFLPACRQTHLADHCPGPLLLHTAPCSAAPAGGCGCRMLQGHLGMAPGPAAENAAGTSGKCEPAGQPAAVAVAGRQPAAAPRAGAAASVAALGAVRPSRLLPVQPWRFPVPAEGGDKGAMPWVVCRQAALTSAPSRSPTSGPCRSDERAAVAARPPAQQALPAAAWRLPAYAARQAGRHPSCPGGHASRFVPPTVASPCPAPAAAAAGAATAATAIPPPRARRMQLLLASWEF